MRKIDLTGQKFGKLTVLFEQPERKNSKIVWHCKCDCGNECDVVGSQLTKTDHPLDLVDAYKKKKLDWLIRVKI